MIQKCNNLKYSVEEDARQKSIERLFLDRAIPQPHRVSDAHGCF